MPDDQSAQTDPSSYRLPVARLIWRALANVVMTAAAGFVVNAMLPSFASASMAIAAVWTWAITIEALLSGAVELFLPALAIAGICAMMIPLAPNVATISDVRQREMLRIKAVIATSTPRAVTARTGLRLGAFYRQLSLSGSSSTLRVDVPS